MICINKIQTEIEPVLMLILEINSSSEPLDHLKIHHLSLLLSLQLSPVKLIKSKQDLIREKSLTVSLLIFMQRLKISDLMVTDTVNNGKLKLKRGGFMLIKSSHKFWQTYLKPQKSLLKLVLWKNKKLLQDPKLWLTVTLLVFPLNWMQWFKFMTNISFQDVLNILTKTWIQKWKLWKDISTVLKLLLISFLKLSNI